MPREERAPRRAVAGVVLAAGSSTRMGANKLVIEVDGEALVVRAVRRAAAAGLNPVVVVLGHDSDRVARALEGVPCRPVVNALHQSGQGSSFRCGIAAIPEFADAAVVLLADMPMVTSDMIAAVVDHYRATGAPLPRLCNTVLLGTTRPKRAASGSRRSSSSIATAYGHSSSSASR